MTTSAGRWQQWAVMSWLGAPGDDTGATDAGAAYLFDGSTGALLKTFLNPTPNESDYFGSFVVAAGDDVLVGAEGDNPQVAGTGEAYEFDGSTGVAASDIHPPDARPA